MGVIRLLHGSNIQQYCQRSAVFYEFSGLNVFLLTAEVAFAPGNGFWEMFCDKKSCETGPCSEVAAFDGSEKCGRHWTEYRFVVESCWLEFCLSRADDAARQVRRSGCNVGEGKLVLLG